MPKYLVTARMCVKLTTTVEAETPEEALEKAHAIADEGGMEELQNDGFLDLFTASIVKE